MVLMHMADPEKRASAASFAMEDAMVKFEVALVAEITEQPDIVESINDEA